MYVHRGGKSFSSSVARDAWDPDPLCISPGHFPTRPDLMITAKATKGWPLLPGAPLKESNIRFIFR